MAVYDSDSPLTHPLDYRLAASGFVVLYRVPTVLDRHQTWLSEHGYRMVYVDASLWLDVDAMHRALADALHFPDYYGNNLEALRDCLSDVAAGDYGWSDDHTGLVLVLNGFDQFVRREPHPAQSLLDGFAGEARIGALIGHRLLCLVQSDDPDLVLAPVGASTVQWNHEEWLDSTRRP